MTSITQQIPNYVGGISQQPDELKVPGQVRVAKNVLPDVTHGLLKRPGGRLIGNALSAYTTTSKWFHYYRDENEQYIGQIQGSDGQIKMWRCSDGQAMTVTNNLTTTTKTGTYTRNTSGVITVTISTHGYKLGETVYLDFTSGATDAVYKITDIVDANNFKVEDGIKDNAITSTAVTSKSNYLIHLDDADIQSLTLNDYTYLTNRNKTAVMLDNASTVNPVRTPEAYIALKKVAYAQQYSVNLFDDITTQTVNTATRIKVHSSNLDNDSSCPNTATEIHKVGTDDDFTITETQTFSFDRLDHGGTSEANFVEDDSSRTYKLTYIPPAWATATYYQIGDIVSANSKIYKATSAGTSTGSTAPSHAPGSATVGGNTWEWLTSSGTYSAESDVQSTQLYHNQPCLQVTKNVQVQNETQWGDLLTDLEAEAHFTHFPFTRVSQRWGNTTAGVTYEWKITGDYSNQISRIIFSRTGGQPHTIGGNNIVEAADGALKIPVGQLDITRYGWNTALNKLGEGRSELYFRLTNTGQAVPDSTGDNYTCRYTTTVDLLHGGYGWQVGDQIRVAMKGGSHVIEVEEISTSQVQANLGLIRPSPTSFDTKTTVTAESILGDLQNDILNAKKSDGTNSSWVGASTDDSTDTTVQIIGNGIYLTRSSNIVDNVEQNTFNISSPSGDLLNVLTDSVKDVADLPNQCKHGYVVKVANSDAEEDDYYVKFIGHNDRDGEGVWEECPEPGVKTQVDPSTMPIQLVRQADGTFTVSQITWEDRLVGDTVTVPEPSFIGKTINKMLFFRNRLVMLSDENVIMSRPGDFFNFWPKSAITFTATDNIDISCSSEYPAIVYDGLQVNSGLVLFTKNQQFMLTTDSDVLSPLTAKINSLSSYNFNFETNPVSLGTTIAFLDNAGKYTRFFEMQAVLREGEPNILEQSKNISKLFPNNIDLIANSRENSTIFFATKGTSKLYGFRYYQTGERRVQQAWFEWTISGEIQHIAMLDDALYMIVKNIGTDSYTMQKFSIKLDDNSHTIVEDDTYRVHLDFAKVYSNIINNNHKSFTGNGSNTSFNTEFNPMPDLSAIEVYIDDIKQTTGFSLSGTNVVFTTAPANNSTIAVFENRLTYVADGDYTKFTHTNDFTNTGDHLYAVAVSTSTDKEFNGLISKVSVFSDNGTYKIKIPGNWTTSVAAKAFDVVLGNAFDMEVEFPTFYVQQQEGERFKSDVQSSLVLHRIKLSLGPTGVYDTTLKRIGKPNYDETFESVMADAYTANTVGIDKEQIATLPVYEKNTNLTLTLKSTHPSPATLYSLNWEGDYSNRYYKRV